MSAYTANRNADNTRRAVKLKHLPRCAHAYERTGPTGPTGTTESRLVDETNGKHASTCHAHTHAYIQN